MATQALDAVEGRWFQAFHSDPLFFTTNRPPKSRKRSQKNIQTETIMRTLDSARESWQELQQYSTLTELKQGVRLDGKSSVATAGGRSACWKAFLIFESVDSTTWLKTLSSSRSAYNSLKAHFMRHLDNPDELAANYDPLSETTDVSVQLFCLKGGRSDGR